MTRAYISHVAGEGWPMQRGVFLQCEECGDVLPSIPQDRFAQCKCRNIGFDVPAGRVGIVNQAAVRVFRDEDAHLWSRLGGK